MNSPSEPPADAAGFLATASAALHRGDLDLAEVYCRQALAIEPGNLNALAVLGAVLHQLARFREAESLFAELTDRSPQTAAFWMNLGTARRASGQLNGALSAYARAAELGERSANFFFNLGLMHLERRDFEAARSVLTQARTLAPGDAEICLEQARACEALGLRDEALAALHAVPDEAARLASALQARFAQQLAALGEVAKAARIAQRLSADRALDPQAALSLVQLLERVNRVAEARGHIEALRSDPRVLTQGVVLAPTEARLLQREGRHEEAVSLLLKEARWRRDTQLREEALFALAHSLDALGRADECFAALEEAHRSQLPDGGAAALSTLIKTAQPMLAAQRSAVPADVASWSDGGAPAAADSPIFIAGAPRSGKMLVELMLDSHPSLVGSEGRPLMRQTIATLSRAALYPQALAHLGSAQLTDARALYWRHAQSVLGLSARQRLIDSDPMNLVQLPAIRRLFPNAPIVWVVRHPYDVIMSIYLQRYASADMSVLSSTLQSTANAYRLAVDHWERHVQLLGLQPLQVKYEQLVADPAATAKLLAMHVAVPWQDSMASPSRRARQKQFLPGESYAEAIEPTNSKSVDRWKRYAARMAAVIEQLQPYAERYGYATAAH